MLKNDFIFICLYVYFIKVFLMRIKKVEKNVISILETLIKFKDALIIDLMDESFQPFGI